MLSDRENSGNLKIKFEWEKVFFIPPPKCQSIEVVEEIKYNRFCIINHLNCPQTIPVCHVKIYENNIQKINSDYNREGKGREVNVRKYSYVTQISIVSVSARTAAKYTTLYSITGDQD